MGRTDLWIKMLNKGNAVINDIRYSCPVVSGVYEGHRGHNIFMGGTNKLHKNGTHRGGYIYIYMGVLRGAKGALPP